MNRIGDRVQQKLIDPQFEVDSENTNKEENFW